MPPRWLGRGLSLRLIGRYKEALIAFEECLRLDPKMAEAWANRGFTLSKLGRNEEALSSLDKALQIDPTNAELTELRKQIAEISKRT